MPNTLTDVSLKELLGAAASVSPTIAIVGARDNPGRPVDLVGRYLIQAGYRVVPVHPVRKSVWGLEAYPTLADVPLPVDIVDLFRAPEFCPDHARECLALTPLPALFWMQTGIFSPEARALLAPTPIKVIEDLCLMVEHRRLFA